MTVVEGHDTEKPVAEVASMRVTFSPHTPLSESTAHQEIALAVALGAPSLVERLCGPPVGQGRERELSALRRFTITGLVAALLRGRFHFSTDTPIFALCGRACTKAGATPDEMTGALDDAAEAVRDELILPEAQSIEDVYGEGAVDAAIAAHCKTVDDFTREAYRQLLAAYAEPQVR